MQTVLMLIGLFLSTIAGVFQCVALDTPSLASKSSYFDTLEDGVYRLKLCAIWPRCLDFEEHIGFTNQSCPGPLVLRDFSTSRNWKSWKLKFSNKGPSSADVTMQMHWDGKGTLKCSGGHIRSKGASLFTSTKDPPRSFMLKMSDSESGCLHIVDKKTGDLFGVSKSCDSLNVRLEPKDDGSGRQRWSLVKE